MPREHTLDIDTHSQENRKQLLTQHLYTESSPHRLSKRQLISLHSVMSRRASKEGCRPGRSSGRRFGVWLQALLRGQRPSLAGGQPGKRVWLTEESLQRLNPARSPSPSSFAFQSTWAFTARPCSVLFFSWLSFKADLKGTDAVQAGGSACQTLVGSLAGW